MWRSLLFDGGFASEIDTVVERESEIDTVIERELDREAWRDRGTRYRTSAGGREWEVGTGGEREKERETWDVMG